MTLRSSRHAAARGRLARCTAAALLVAAGAAAQTPVFDDPQASAEPSAAELERRGLDLALGRGVAADPAGAAPLLERAAAAGRPVAAAALGDLYATGRGVRPDPIGALALYREAAERGVAHAQARVGGFYYFGFAGLEQDFARARRWLSAAALQESAEALHLLGVMHARGAGVDADAELAYELKLRAAELSFLPALLEVGLALVHDDTRRDLDKGVRMLERVAAIDARVGAYNLAWEYLSGVELPRNIERAVELLSLAVDAESEPAMLWLAELHAKGIGVERDIARAEQLRARALGSASADRKNSFAWELSVSPDSLLRNGPLAVRIMEAVLDVPENRTPARLDTLAAAYAEAGRFDAAVAAQQSAIDALPLEASERDVIVFRERLELYRSGEAYRRRE